MATSITYSTADGIDRNEPGAAADLLDLLAGGHPAWHADAATEAAERLQVPVDLLCQQIQVQVERVCPAVPDSEGASAGADG